MATLPKISVQNLPPYSYAPTAVPGAERVIQLGQNELSIEPGPKVWQAIIKHDKMFQNYGDPQYQTLRDAIANVHSIPPERLSFGAGSVELMSYLVLGYLDKGDAAVCSQYGYKYFETVVSLAGATVIHAPEKNFHVDVEAMLDAVTPQTKIVFLVNPGNPTGTAIPASDICWLRNRLPENIMLVVDSAYAEFMGEDSEILDLVTEGHNVVVLRTFSKGYGLAALRIGWCYGSEDIISTLDKIRPVNSISPLSIAAATAAMEDQKYLQQTCAKIIALREGFRKFVEGSGLKALPANGNFITLLFPDYWALTALETCEALRQKGIILRPLAAFGITNGLRVSIGSWEEMNILRQNISALA